VKKKPLDIRITRLFKKYIAIRPNGNCQILFALTELDQFVDEIMEEIMTNEIPTKNYLDSWATSHGFAPIGENGENYWYYMSLWEKENRHKNYKK